MKRAWTHSPLTQSKPRRDRRGSTCRKNGSVRLQGSQRIRHGAQVDSSCLATPVQTVQGASLVKRLGQIYCKLRLPRLLFRKDVCVCTPATLQLF